VSLAGQPEMRGYRISDMTVSEVPLELT
jgi:hypothetical protein